MSVREFLEAEQQIMLGLNPGLGEGYVTKSIQDFVLQNAVQFEMKGKPDHIEWGKPGNCFGNAYEIVAEDAMWGGEQYEYVEGYAQSLYPIHHAWVLDAHDGKAFDVTWRPSQWRQDVTPDYLGVVFPFDLVEDITTEKGTYGVLSHPPLHKREWKSSLR